jgi:hypothetical protein
VAVAVDRLLTSSSSIKAPQTFHQSWDNITNNALRHNFREGKKLPVRVFRGPKLPGPYGTAHSGGGYRYDGLYQVVSAELVKGQSPHNKSLLTAMFRLERVGQDDGYKFMPLTQAVQNGHAKRTTDGTSSVTSSSTSIAEETNDATRTGSKRKTPPRKPESDDNVRVADVLARQGQASDSEDDDVPIAVTLGRARADGPGPPPMGKAADGEEISDDVGGSNLKLACVNARVEVRFDNGKMYLGTISKVERSERTIVKKKPKTSVCNVGVAVPVSSLRVQIQYDDGDVEWSVLPDPDVKIIEQKILV